MIFENRQNLTKVMTRFHGKRTTNTDFVQVKGKSMLQFREKLNPLEKLLSNNKNDIQNTSLEICEEIQNLSTQ